MGRLPRLFAFMSKSLTLRQKQNRQGLVLFALLALALAGAGVTEWRYLGPLPLALGAAPDAPAALAHWPWTEARFDRPHTGVGHWFDRSSPDGTQIDLFDFDFLANPHLKFGLYDQDEDDAQPFDDKAHPWPMSVAQASKHMNEMGRGQVLVACNGLFYNYDITGPGASASHVTPVVLNGIPHYTGTKNHRWTFGVKVDKNGDQTFQAIHLPDTATLKRSFTYAAGGAQCLIKDGRIQSLPPFAVGNSTHPAFAYMKTSRVSWGWSRDSHHLYLLFVKEPDEESISEWAREHRFPLEGGWSLPDEARFWHALGVWGAVNSDAGDVAQLVYRLPEGKYEISEPRWSSSNVRRVLPADLSGAPPGGSLMYWYVRDSSP